MARNKIEEKDEIISVEMMKKIKASYPIKMQEVSAQKEDGTVLMYPNELMDRYIKKYIEKYCEDVDDYFIFEKLSTQWSTKDNGSKYKTGWFCPKSFWDAMFRIIAEARV